MQILLLAIFGLIFGSFANALIWRLNDPKAPKIWQGRSMCPRCRHILDWKDNIPLLSFLFLLGKCRYCHNKISWQYPIVELTTALVFAMTGFNPVTLGIGLVFIVIFFSDLIYGFIPDEMILVGIVLSVMSFWPRPESLITGFISAGVFLLLFLLTKQKGIGFGDVKLALLMGLVLGWPKIIVAFWIAFIIGGVWAVILLALHRTKLSATMALGPFLIIGVLVAALWTKPLLQILGIP